MARIRYVEKHDAPQEIAELFAKMESRGVNIANIWKMLAHSPSTLVHLMRMGNALLSKTQISPKLREMAILRSACILDCEYEKVSHTMFGKEVGMTDEQVRAIDNWENSNVFDKTERAVLSFTDEITKYARVTDETFSALSQILNEGMMVELAMTIGFYGMLARVILPFQVDLNEKVPTSSSQILGRAPGK